MLSLFQPQAPVPGTCQAQTMGIFPNNVGKPCQNTDICNEIMSKTAFSYSTHKVKCGFTCT